MGQKGLELAFFGQQMLFLADFFFSKLGGYRKSFCPKKLSGIGGYPPPLTEKIRLVVFCEFPKIDPKLRKMSAIDAQGGAEGQLVQKCWNM